MSVIGLLAVTAVASLALPARSEIVPDRRPFAAFPMTIDEWRGREEVMGQTYIDVLKLDDYILADYRRPGGDAPVNFYVAYYGSQRKGASAHSPRSCIPGGGWEISDMSETLVPVANPGRVPVNRIVIAKGTSRQLVYYWFQQRGRHLTNEYLVKLMIFWDALNRSRTDGALVRLVTPVLPNEDIDAADRRLADFLEAAYDPLEEFIPD